VWPVAVGLRLQRACQWSGYEWTVEGSVGAWAAVARDAAWPAPTAMARTASAAARTGWPAPAWQHNASPLACAHEGGQW